MRVTASRGVHYHVRANAAENLDKVAVGVFFVINRPRLAIPLVAALALSLAGTTVPASADQISIISVQTGHSLVLDAPQLTRVAVGDSRIAGASAGRAGLR